MGQADDRRFEGILLCFLTMAFFAVQCLAAPSQEKRVSGYIETVRIHPGELALSARIDTGAMHSSLNARGVERFSRDGKPWVRFSLTNEAKRTVIIEGQVHRIARIRQHGGGVQERDVMMLGVCLGTVFKTVEVNLVDRGGFDFQMLVGRSFLGEDFLVDPSERFLLEPKC